MKRPSIARRAVADHHAMDGERIIEVSSTGGGGLISLRVHPDVNGGRLVISLYRLDDGVCVRAPAVPAAAVAMLREAVDAWPQYDGAPDTDLNISGADMVDWFGQWRARASAQLARIAAPPAPLLAACREALAALEFCHLPGRAAKTHDAMQLLRTAVAGAFPDSGGTIAAPDAVAMLAALRDCVGAIESMAQQIRQMRGMFPDSDGAISAALDDGAAAAELARATMERAKAGGVMPAEPPRIAVTVRDGCVTGVYSDAPAARYVVVDYDGLHGVDGAAAESAVADPGNAESYQSCDGDVDAAKAERDSELADHRRKFPAADDDRGA